MTTQTVRLAVLAIALFTTVPASSRAQAPGAADPAALPRAPGVRAAADAAAGRISGRVVSAETGLPLRRAAVTLHVRPLTEPGGQTTLTDDDGAFAFDGVGPGRYDLRASKTRYVASNVARRADRRGRSHSWIEIAAGQRLDGVTLTLISAGAITGRVLDAAGEPVAGATVMAMRLVTANGVRRLGPVGGLVPSGSTRETDDTGAFRLHGLRAGRYYVAARSQDTRRYMNETLRPDVTGHTLTYYPSTPVAAEAQAIEVLGGADAPADITLVETRLAAVSGSVVDANGQPALHGMIMANGAPDGLSQMGMDAAALLRKDGAFTLAGLVPGDYVLFVRPYFDEAEVSAVARSGRVEGDGYRVPVSVGEGGIQDLRIVVPPKVPVTGRVHFEGGTAPSTMAVRVFATQPPSMTGPKTVEADREGRFAFELRPGTWQIGASPPSGWMLKRMEFRGRDVVPGDDLEITAEPGMHLDIVVTNQITVVAGDVKDDRSQAVRDYVVMLFPEAEGDRRSADYRRTRVAHAGGDGRFRVEGLPPGDYRAIALPDLDGEEMDPDALEALRGGATALTVAPAQTQTITLTLATLP